jgi:hypothetical protein
VWSGADLAISQDILVPESGYYPFAAYVRLTPENLPRRRDERLPAGYPAGRRDSKRDRDY